MRETYQLWVHRGDGRIFTVRVTRHSRKHKPEMTGVYGPLDGSAALSADVLARYPYEADDALTRLLARRAEYRIFLPRPAPVAPPGSAPGRKAARSIYAFWVHRTSHEIYAVRLHGKRITGACGPLAFANLEVHDQSFDGDLSTYNYEDARVLARVQEQRNDFTLLANHVARYQFMGWALPWEVKSARSEERAESLSSPAGPAVDREAQPLPSAAPETEPSLVAASD